ncbi:HlyD family secretion protein [Synechococcus sp. N26]|uniref:HlyD family secretion protein n=1 Tax=Synechococcus sp. N26 TaxID=2575513 RepID=UPI001FCA92A6|nr:HlyD family efflux transporter periplasmic adaptor subunit [Synechococcus sp. N26]
MADHNDSQKSNFQAAESPVSRDSKPLPQNLEFWEGSSVHVNQGRHWSSAIIWISTTLFGVSLLWAFTSKIDQSVSVAGRLEPAGSVRDVESPSGGVIDQVFVKDGDFVSTGTPLFTVEGKGLISRRRALRDTQKLLQLQALSLKSVLVSNGDPTQFDPLPSLPSVSDTQLQSQLFTARQQSVQIRSQLEQIASRLGSRLKTLSLNKRIVSDLTPLYESGAMGRNQYLGAVNQIQEIEADVSALKEERTRVIGQAASQLNQVDRQLLSIKSQLVDLEQTIDYRTVRAPTSGRVFDSQLSTFSVISADQVALKLVPDNRLEAKVSINNSDIGFVKVGMPVTVSVDSFPAGEFGYIDGTLSSLGSDVLKPDSENPAYRFPASIRLEQQEVLAGDKSLNLQSGMSVSANIKLRSRPVISILSDLFVKQLDGVKRFR